MAQFDVIEVLTRMRDTGMVPVFYHADPDKALQVVEACYAGGVRVFEFTNRGDGAHEVFRHVLRYARLSCPDMALGAGTVTDAPTAALYLQLGADFVVGPMFNPDVAQVCHRRGVPYVPGCGTATEVSAAQACGCTVCKVFPGEVLGPRFVKSLHAPMPWAKLMVTGGVEPTEESLAAWFGAGAFCVGMGSRLLTPDVVSAADGAALTARCAQVLGLISKVRP